MPAAGRSSNLGFQAIQKIATTCASIQFALAIQSLYDFILAFALGLAITAAPEEGGGHVSPRHLDPGRSARVRLGEATIAGPAGGGGSVAASAGLAVGKRLARHSGAWALLRIAFGAARVRCLPDLVRTCAKRSRERRELLTYLAQDHPAAADIGMSRAADGEAWAHRPFWCP